MVAAAAAAAATGNSFMPSVEHPDEVHYGTAAMSGGTAAASALPLLLLLPRSHV